MHDLNTGSNSYWDNYIPMPNTRNIERLSYHLRRRQNLMNAPGFGSQTIELSDPVLINILTLLRYIGEDLLSSCLPGVNPVSRDPVLRWIGTYQHKPTYTSLTMIFGSHSVQICLCEIIGVGSGWRELNDIGWEECMPVIVNTINEFNNGRYSLLG